MLLSSRLQAWAAVVPAPHAGCPALPACRLQPGERLGAASASSQPQSCFYVEQGEAQPRPACCLRPCSAARHWPARRAARPLALLAATRAAVLCPCPPLMPRITRCPPLALPRRGGGALRGGRAHHPQLGSLGSHQPVPAQHRCRSGSTHCAASNGCSAVHGRQRRTRVSARLSCRCRGAAAAGAAGGARCTRLSVCCRRGRSCAWHAAAVGRHGRVVGAWLANARPG